MADLVIAPMKFHDRLKEYRPVGSLPSRVESLRFIAKLRAGSERAVTSGRKKKKGAADNRVARCAVMRAKLAADVFGPDVALNTSVVHHHGC